MTTLRFRISGDPSAPLISKLRKLTSHSIAEIRERIANGLPMIEITAFTNSWREDRERLVHLASCIESKELPLTVTEVFESGAESPVSSTMLRNLIAQFRDIELQTQRSTMLELGEIADPSEFEPYDDDWTK